MATAVSQRVAIADATTAGYSKTSRRQYQACDQCRKSRRACDAGTLRVANFPFREDEQPESTSATCDACSNCARTSKRCTFIWLSRLPLQGLPKGVKRKLESTSLPALITDNVPDCNYQTSSSTNGYSTTETTTLPHILPASNSFHLMNHSRRTGLSKYNISPTYACGEQSFTYSSTSPEACYSLGPDSLQTAPLDAISMLPSTQPIPLGNSPPVLPQQEITNHGSWPPPSLPLHETPSTSPVSMSNGSTNAKSKIESSPSLTSLSSEPSCEEEILDGYDPKRVKRTIIAAEYSRTKLKDRRPPAGKRAPNQPNVAVQLAKDSRPTPATISTFQIRLADKATKRSIYDGLTQVYRDSFENSLSCWVTERNCPYEIELKGLFGANANLASTAEETALRLRDKRFTSRVSRLDSAFARLRGRELSASENHAANKALNDAVMAFASQWSQSSHNPFWQSKEGMAQLGACQSHAAHPPTLNNPLASAEYERQIQKNLWHVAWNAIQAVAEIDSFKVILAYMIFALTQRPVDAKDPSAAEAQISPIDNTTGSRRGSEDLLDYDMLDQGADPAMETIAAEQWDPFYANDLEALASPPIYLEAAVRNLFSWRRKIERYRRLRSKNRNDHGHGSMGALTAKDHQTFNLLFWLGVMCDTTSSAISKRPLVISDEDCAMIQERVDDMYQDVQSDLDQYRPGDEEQDNDTGSLWGDYLLKVSSARSRKTQHRWPCTLDEAATILQEAIPVKVLMFRKVAALQTLAYRRTPPHRLEKCINDALDVYRHWNSMYLPFMNDCVSGHNSLPANVQSWYVILDGHWHYGCLLLADTISQVDKEGKTMKPQRNLRANCHLIRELRHDNAVAIAKIAEASLAEHVPSVPNNPQFHFACNGSAILTEPWTDILVRAMGSACKVFINCLSAWHNPADPKNEWVRTTNTYEELYNQAEFCIQGMRLLGRKSDAANCTAELFWKTNQGG
ncbi:hypothetical protein H2200_005962 [Cladophialophora chaetospira]|uniref:Zn(2)-C6 fungal-type domain-containing protein n=1 Tax=Cladophialophora chaetospira TaxID=386627 RepID=A0AA38XA22_9EURO|nr:hypothetical protein H2200_005962 [Cladophialophora chaetospira]